jgi:hypothetical protein
MYNFAQLNEKNEVIGLLNTPNDESDVQGMIMLEEGQSVNLGDIYNAESGTFSPPEPPLPTLPDPTNTEIAHMISDLDARMIIGGLIE